MRTTGVIGMCNRVCVAGNSVVSISTELDQHDADVDVVTIVGAIDEDRIVRSGLSVRDCPDSSRHGESGARAIENVAGTGVVLTADTDSLLPDADSDTERTETSLFVRHGDERRGPDADARVNDSPVNELLAKVVESTESGESPPSDPPPSLVDEPSVSLPDEPDTPVIRSVQTQLANLDGVERTRVLSDMYGPSLVSPPPDTTFKIALHTERNTAYVVHFSEANGWENVEPIPPGDIWEQHTLATASTDS